MKRVTPADAGFDAARLERLTGWMERYVDAGKIPFGHVRLSRGGDVVFDSAVGLSDIASGQPYSSDTLVRLYSMTKPVTAVALMQLVERGEVHLGDPVAQWIPAFADIKVCTDEPGRLTACQTPMTLHHLLTHTSGLSYGLFGGDAISERYLRDRLDFDPQDGSNEEICQRLAQLPLLFQPGSQWHYGVSIDVIGRVIEVVSGEPLDRYFEEHIFKPLGMRDTCFQVPEDQRHRLAALYSKTSEQGLELVETGQDSIFADEQRPVTCMSGGSGLVGTMSDYWAFAEMLRNGGRGPDGVQILGRKTIELMTRNHLDGDIAAHGVSSFAEVSFSGVGFGLGLYSIVDPARTGMVCSAGEYGWGGLASTVFFVDPGEDLSVIFLTQQIPSSGYPLRRELRALVYGALR